MRIATNVTALNTYNNYTSNNNKIADSVAKLSSGYAINSAADNAAGLAISEKMRAQIRGLDKASSNSQDAISLVQTAESALSSADEILQRMRELAVQSSSDTNEDSIDREALQSEFEQLSQELNDISSTTTFNNKNLLDGTLSSSTSYVASTLSSYTSIQVGQASAGNYTVTVNSHAAVTANVTSGVAATVTTATSGAASISSDFDMGTFTAINTDDYNNNTYTLAVSGTDITSMTFSLKNSADETVASVTVDASSLNTTDAVGSLTVNFSDYGSMAITSASTSNNITASELTSAAGTTYEFDDDGVDSVTTEAKAAYGTITINGESVDVYAGDSTAVFAEQGISLSFEELTDDGLEAGLDTLISDGDLEVGTTSGNALTIQTGANSSDELEINISSCSAESLNVSLLDISSQSGASSAIDVVDSAINAVSSQRAYLGAIQNRLDYKIDNLTTSSENLTSAESSIRDVDMASEMTTFTNANILQQAATAMLAQANSLPQNVLSLLQ